MNLLKATVAAAAVITCSLGNDYPAKAQTSPNWAYEYGYSFGFVVTTCALYRQGSIGHSDLTGYLKIARSLDDTPTKSINRKILSNFDDMERRNQPLAFCRPVVRGIFTEVQASSPYQSADLLY